MVSLIIKLKNHKGFSVSCVPLYFKNTVLPCYNDNLKKGIKGLLRVSIKSGLNDLFTLLLKRNSTLLIKK